MPTLEELDGERWPDPGDTTYLVRRCTELRRVPLAEFTAEDLRIMLGQQLSVPVLLPKALDLLAGDPWVSGDFFPGDLLEVVLRLPDAAWAGRESTRDALRRVLAAGPPS